MTLDKISKYFALVTVIAFIVGYLFNSSYYESFNINILSYINNIELLYSLLPTTSVALCLLFFIYLNYDDYKNRDIADVSSFEKMMTSLSIGNFSILFLILLITFLPQIWLGNGYKGQQFIFIGAYSFYYYWSSKRYIREYFSSGKLDSRILIFYFIVILGLCSVYSSYNAGVIKRWGNHKKYVIKTKNELIVTDKNKFVIGETQSSIFLYDKKNKTSRIISRESIDSLVIK